MYCSIDDVKAKLKISDNSEDNAIAQFIEQADAFIDALLEAKGINTPLNPVPNIIKHASADLAASLFRFREAPPNEIRARYQQAKEHVDAYIAQKGAGKMIRLSE